MAISLVLGCSGQDGTLLCRRLLHSNAHRVIGVDIGPFARWQYGNSRFEYVSLDLGGPSGPLRELLASKRPQRIFHVAAVHASAEQAAYESIFEAMLAVNVRTVHTVLEHLRTEDPGARLIYASSAKAFGSPLPARVHENSPRTSTCLYGTTKNAAGDLIRYYRRVHGTLSSQLYLFNHESELRSAGFFIPKLVAILAAAMRGERKLERFQTLNFHCDWGSADEYMGIMIDVLERSAGEDFVLATGRTVHARSLVHQVFATQGIAMRDYLIEGNPTADASYYAADISKLRALGLSPKITIEELIADLTTAATQSPAET